MKLMLPVMLAGVLLTSSSYAQTEKTEKGREKMMEEVKKEKIRYKPVKISDAIKASENEQKKSLLKTTGNTVEKKLSTATSPGIEEGEAYIAINPNNPAQLVLSFISSSSTIPVSYPVYYTNDSGNTWTKSLFNPATMLSQDFPGGFIAGGGDPVLAYDKNGKLFFSWIYLVINSAQDTIYEAMYWASSTNNGQSWTYAPGANHFVGYSKLDPNSFSQFPGSDGFYDRQWMTVDMTNGTYSGRIYTSFLYIPTPSENQNLGGTWVRSFNPTSNNWNARTQAFSGGSQFANLVVDNTGKLHVTFADVDQNRIYHVSSTDGGQTYTVPHLITTGSNLFGHQGGGDIHDRENSAVNLAVDAANNLHIVWTDYDLPTETYKSYYSKSTNGGIAWSTPVFIDNFLPTGLKSLMPVVSTFGNKVTIGAYAINASKVSDYYYISSMNNGTTWGLPVKVSTQQTNFPNNIGNWFGDYFNSVRTDCKVYNIWSDGRGTTGTKMYVAITNDCNVVGVTELTPVNGTYSVKNIFPNPVSDELNLSVTSARQNQLSIHILDIAGKQLAVFEKSISSGENKIHLDLPALPAGNYVLALESEDGFKYSRVIVKN
jgi:hypothetical protein